ncbi:hypothetical protein P8452_27354 [Trifolium repens]|nr:hypothetical protein P8452_27354 [Trifolium repens]
MFFVWLGIPLDVEVYDADATPKNFFWDNTLDELVGLTATTLLQKMKHLYQFLKIQAYVLMCKDSKELVAKIQEKLSVTGPNVSASAENDISSSSQKTPATRRSAGKRKAN